MQLVAVLGLQRDDGSWLPIGQVLTWPIGASTHVHEVAHVWGAASPFWLAGATIGDSRDTP